MSDFAKLSDSEILLLLRQDKLSAFKEIYSRYWKKLYSDAYKRLKNKELAEEAVQEIFTNFWIKRQSLQINTTVGGYLHLAVVNKVIDYHRKELLKAKYKEAFKIVQSTVDTSTEDGILLRDLAHTIEAEVEHLPEKCRSVYQLSRIEHKSNKEIAHSMGISEKTVENHLTKALKKLRLGLSHYLLILTAILLR
jgi:RNA polymerase sigma-70 factor (family 1)